jgi:hypothetical protein
MTRDARVFPRIIVVGERHSRFVTEMVRLAGEYDLAVTQCDDIYSAATELARRPDRVLMVVGALRQLAIGKYDFFSLAQRNGVRCCCLLDREADVERDRILTVVRLGVRLAGEIADIRTFLDERLAAEGDRSAEADGEDLLSEKFRESEDEIKALLWQESDG